MVEEKYDGHEEYDGHDANGARYGGCKNHRSEGKEDLEEKIGVLGRLKYVAIPSIVAVVSYFTPEIKKNYGVLPEDTKAKLRNVALVGTGVVGVAATIYSGYGLYKNHANKRNAG